MKRSLWQRICAFGVAMLMVVSLVPPLDANATGEWSDINIYQKKCGHSSGCTVVTYQLILQNSWTLKPEYQLDKGTSIQTTGGKYGTFDSACNRAGLNSGDGVYYDSLPKVAASVCKEGVTWKFCYDPVDGVSNVETDVLRNDCKLIGAVGGVRFDKMSDAEQRAIMKAFYNGDYFLVMGIYYVGHEVRNNGTADYPANHWVMFTGVDDSGIYMNDPIYGSARVADCKSYNGQYKIRYIIPLKNNTTSPRTIAGGQVAQISPDEQQALGNLGIPLDVAQGVVNGQSPGVNVAYSDSSLLSYCNLEEPNLEETLLLWSDAENLRQDDLEVLEGWRTNIEGNKKEFGFIAVLRWIVSMVGILITLWAIFIYLAFWFDHVNSFVYLDLLHILTLGQLHICSPGEKPTFSLGKDVKNKTVSHWQILCICITAIVFGATLISGLFYNAVTALVRFIQGLIA